MKVIPKGSDPDESLGICETGCFAVNNGKQAVTYREKPRAFKDITHSEEVKANARAIAAVPSLIAEVKRQAEQIAELERDRERLEWLESHPFIAYRDRDLGTSELHGYFTLVDEDKKPRTGIVKDTLRQCIDAAMQTNPER